MGKWRIIGGLKMTILYSKVPPMPFGESLPLISEQLVKEASTASRIDIAVGYVSVDGLDKLDSLVSRGNIKQICLVVGMYLESGIPESIYNRVRLLHKKWQDTGKGEIRFVNNMSYHGKVYLFWQPNQQGNDELKSAVLGSANLSVLAPLGSVSRQYELATTITNSDQLHELSTHIEELKTSCTVSATNLNNFKVIHERIEVLGGIEEVLETTESEQDMYRSLQTDIEIRIPIKAPLATNRFSTARHDYARSNINVAYGSGRYNKLSGGVEPRNWYEVQITVNKAISTQPNYPKNKPFWIVTDDGYKFEAHTTADNNKQLTAYGKTGNDRVFGRWIKGRLATAGYVKPVDNTATDTERLGVVTQEMLNAAQMRVMVLTKTSTQEYGVVFNRLAPTSRNKKGALDKKHWTRELLDVWAVHFEGVKS